MINELHIENFLSHDKSSLQFSPGLNIIVGPSDAGKSAIVQALRWVIHNRPLGDSFRSYWGGPTAVSVHTDQGVVLRYKDDKKNKYQIGLSDFGAIGTVVPDEVLQILNMGELNLQTQFERHFLISNSAGEVAKYFNKIAHLDKIDSGIAFTKKTIIKIKNEIKSHEAQIEELGEYLTEFDIIPQVEAVVVDLEALDKREGELESNLITLTSKMDDLAQVQDDMAEYEELVEMEEEIDQITKVINEMIQVNFDMQKLGSAVSEVRGVTVEMRDCQTIIELEDKVNGILATDVQIEAEELEMRNLKWKIDKVTEIDIDIDLQRNGIAELEHEFHQNVGEICPLCEQEIK